MAVKHKLVRGALILTAAGLISRLMGFFFRIFLSHAFGEENVGLYQLVFPIYALCLSIGTSGIQTALSRTVARKMSLNKPVEAKNALICALFITVVLSAAEILAIQQNAEAIALHFLGDARCAELLVIISYALPCASVHSCICGYYFGRKETGIPAVSQLLEQSARIAGVLLIYHIGKSQGVSFQISLAVIGLILGELASSSFCLYMLRKQETRRMHTPSFLRLARHAPKLLIPSLPLTGSRVLLNLLQSTEAVSIPLKLQLYGMTGREALSVYGVLTGMALPCILFPSALTNSVSTMLLPEVADLQAVKDRSGFLSLVRKTACSCIAMGSICCVFLFVTGPWIGRWLFHSSLAGTLIRTLAFMCPFLYTNGTLISMINGTGKTSVTFLINGASLSLRLFSVFLLIPLFGILGYLWGMLASQILVFLSCLIFLIRFSGKRL